MQSNKQACKATSKDAKHERNSFICAYIVGEFALYMVVPLASHDFLVFIVSSTYFLLYISHIEPLEEIVTNYKNGGG
jgi:hypothetical protein